MVRSLIKILDYEGLRLLKSLRLGVRIEYFKLKVRIESLRLEIQVNLIDFLLLFLMS